jgi:crotonobetainyl-CoA:carnitine CoA-transferase CaiB-like acyl-CoA transferase
MQSVFTGLKVIDTATFVAAPGAAVILADFGADVIKVEPVGGGDPYRQVPLLPNLPKAEHNYAWTMAARSKRGLALDLKTPAGQAVLHQLVRSADVFITNQSPAGRLRLGIDYERLAALNPRLVYASLTGYGETGAEAEKPGFDANAYWARSGLADNVKPDPDGPPASPTLGMGDQPSAMTLYAGIVTALLHRECTGQGAWVTSSLLANGAWSNAPALQAVLSGGHVPYRLPRDRARNALTCFYRCRDGRWFMISLVQEERDWPRFAQVLGVPQLVDDPRFAVMAQRRANASELVRELDAAFTLRDAAEWQSHFEAAGLTVGVVARAEDVVVDPQMREAGAFVPAEGVPGMALTVDSPFRLQGVPKAPARIAPGVGEHSDDILREHGYGAEDILALRQSGVLG